MKLLHLRAAAVLYQVGYLRLNFATVISGVGSYRGGNENFGGVSGIKEEFLLTSSWHIEVKIKTVFTLIGEQRQQFLQIQESSPGELQQRLGPIANVGRPLRTHGPKTVRQPGVHPDGRRHRRHVPATSKRQ